MTEFKKLARPSFVLPIVLVLLIAGSLMQRIFGHFINRDVDFFVYYFAAQTIHDDPKSGLLYDGDLDGNPEDKNAPAGSALYNKGRAAGVDQVMLYLYPPLLADALVPISNMAPQRAASLWRTFNLCFIFLSLVALARMVRIPLLSWRFAVLAVAVYSFFPIHEALAVGQITILMFTLWTIAVVSYSEGAVALSAAVIAFATMLKITPVLVVPIFIILKDRRWLAWYAVTIASLILVLGTFNGWHTLETSGKVLAAVGGSVAVMQNKCISAFLAWIYYGRFVSMQDSLAASPPHLLSIAEKAASLGFYLICLFLVWRQRIGTNLSDKVTAFAMFAMVTPLLSPVSWRHAYVVAIVPLVILWMQALRTKVSTAHTMLLALSTLAIGTLYFDLIAGKHLPFAIQLLSAGMLVISTVALCLETLSHKMSSTPTAAIT